MATQQRTSVDVYRCPDCDGVLAAAHGSWGCTECHYVPGHCAD
jgi:ribosomal protein S27AE